MAPFSGAKFSYPGCCSLCVVPFSLWSRLVSLFVYNRRPTPVLSSPLIPSSPSPPPIHYPPRCGMNTIIESKQGNLTHSSTVMVWILAVCAGTYHAPFTKRGNGLTHIDHFAQYSFCLARGLFSISLIVGMLPVRWHPSQLRRITVSTRPPRVSPTLPWDVINGCVSVCRGRFHTGMSPSTSPSPSVSTTT